MAVPLEFFKKRAEDIQELFVVAVCASIAGVNHGDLVGHLSITPIAGHGFPLSGSF